jgi:hypothetical protein
VLTEGRKAEINVNRDMIILTTTIRVRIIVVTIFQNRKSRLKEATSAKVTQIKIYAIRIQTQCSIKANEDSNASLQCWIMTHST